MCDVETALCSRIRGGTVTMLLVCGTFACDQRIYNPMASCEFDVTFPYEGWYEHVLLVGDTARATAVALDGQGHVIPDFRPEWSSSSPSVASVDSAGLILAKRPGQTEIKSARCGAGWGVTVIGRPAKLRLFPDTMEMVPGTFGYVGFSYRDDNGLYLKEPFLQRLFQWRSSDPDIAFVDSMARVSTAWTQSVTANAEGAASIIASWRELVDTVLVRVAWVALGAPTSGEDYTCALTSDGKAYCWGAGAPGGGSDRPGSVVGTAPTPVTGVPEFSYLSVGRAVTCALTQAGALFCWGDNSVGQLGLGTTDQSFEPHVVMEGSTFIHVSVGYAHTCALASDRTAYCWGRNTRGELGTDETGEVCTIHSPKTRDYDVPCSPTPISLGLATDLRSIHAGSAISCGLTDGGDLYCWGGDYGSQPTQIEPGRRWTDIGLGGGASSSDDYFACGLDHVGRAYCWGKHSLGIGDGVSTESPVPVPVAGDLVFGTLSVGYAACGITIDDEVYCWGGRSGYSFGGLAPVRLNTDIAFDSISVGYDFACGLVTGDGVYCWGTNERGQLGVHSVDYTEAPVKVEGQK